MKIIFLIMTLLLIGCGQNSSPEGRMTSKMNDIRKEFDSLKQQNAMILDSLGKINEHLNKIEHK